MSAGGINNPVLEWCIYSICNVHTYNYVYTYSIILDTIYIHIKKQYTWVL